MKGSNYLRAIQIYNSDKNKTLREIGEELNVTHQRIGQIFKKEGIKLKRGRKFGIIKIIEIVPKIKRLIIFFLDLSINLFFNIDRDRISKTIGQKSI